MSWVHALYLLRLRDQLISLPWFQTYLWERYLCSFVKFPCSCAKIWVFKNSLTPSRTPLIRPGVLTRTSWDGKYSIYIPLKKKFMGYFFRLSTDFSRPSHYCWHRSKLLRQDNFWCAVSLQAVRLGRQYRSSTKRYLEITSPTRICSQLCVWSNGNLPCQGHGRERTGARFQLERFSLRGVTPGRISLRVLRGTHTGLYCL